MWLWLCPSLAQLTQRLPGLWENYLSSHGLLTRPSLQTSQRADGRCWRSREMDPSPLWQCLLATPVPTQWRWQSLDWGNPWLLSLWKCLVSSWSSSGFGGCAVVAGFGFNEPSTCLSFCTVNPITHILPACYTVYIVVCTHIKRIWRQWDHPWVLNTLMQQPW